MRVVLAQRYVRPPTLLSAVRLLIRAVKPVVRWVRLVVRVPSGRRGITVRARGPPN